MTLQLGPFVIQQPLWLLLMVALLIACILARQFSTQNDWTRVITPAVFAYLGGKGHGRLQWNITLVTAALVALSLSQPTLRQSDDDTWRHSTGWVLLADVSRSMTLTDIVPSRLSGVRETLIELAHQSGARPVSLILYAGDAFLVAPPAFDKSVFVEHAALLEHGVISTEGSNLARALSLATSVVQESKFVNARVFVLGDSGGISKASLAAARFLADNGHQLDVLVFGTRDDSSVAANQQVDLSLDEDGAKALALNGNGTFLMANRFGSIDLDELDLQQQADASTHSELRSLVWKQQSHWILLAAIPLVLMLFRREASR